MAATLSTQFTRRDGGDAPSRALVAVTALFFAWTAAIAAADKPKSLDFAGRLTAVDLVAKTITVQGPKKTFVFTIDIRRCDVARNGNWWNQPGAEFGSLGLAKVGDAVIGKLSLSGPHPVVVRLDLMGNPRFGLPFPSKPGFITSPYASSFRTPIDVRGYPRGAMVKDPPTGKIILVP